MKLRNPMSFAVVWNQILWNAMMKTGKGYRMYSLKNTGKGQDRRADKLSGESKLQRKARDQSIGSR